MDRTSTRAWRRIKKKRVWYKRLKFIFNAFAPAYVENIPEGTLREAATWKELRNVKWCQVYRTTGKPCSCELCTGERYNRISFKKDTISAIREQLEID